MKKILLFLLVLVMILPLAAGCGKKKPETPTGTDSSSDTTKDASALPPTDDRVYNFNILDTLPSAKYGGKEFTVKVMNNYMADFSVEHYTGDLLDDARYNWLKTVEERYDVQINYINYYTEAGGYYKTVLDDVMQGVNNVNLYCAISSNVYRAILGGCYRDWNTLDSAWIDLSAKRWAVSLNESVSFNGKLFAATGDLGTSKLQYTQAIFYNEQMLSNYGVNTNDFYDMVDNYEWTFEALKATVKDIYIDSDMSETKSAGDTYGYYSNDGNAYFFWQTAFGVKLITINEDHTLTPNLYNEKNINILEKLNDFYFNNQSVYSGNMEMDHDRDKFFNEEAAMVTVPLKECYSHFRFMDTSFGILPQPMYDSDQHEYFTYMNDQYAAFGIPITLPESDLNFTAHIADALCAESSESLYYQYYEVALKGRYSKDPDTARMVDILMSNVVIDPTMQFGTMLDMYPYILGNMVMQNNTNLASENDKVSGKVGDFLNEILAAYQ
ncbi:MAG: hypothetical protein J5885_04105 [Clostridia bacterium]|nr:hypothetical protein [Clostridia bacterium]